MASSRLYRHSAGRRLQRVPALRSVVLRSDHGGTVSRTPAGSSSSWLISRPTHWVDRWSRRRGGVGGGHANAEGSFDTTVEARHSSTCSLREGRQRGTEAADAASANAPGSDGADDAPHLRSHAVRTVVAGRVIEDEARHQRHQSQARWRWQRPPFRLRCRAAAPPVANRSNCVSLRRSCRSCLWRWHDRLRRHRRDRRSPRSTPCVGRDISQLEELPAGVRPTQCSRDRSLRTRRIVKLVPAVGVGLQNAGKALKMPREVLVPAVARGVIQCSRLRLPNDPSSGT